MDFVTITDHDTIDGCRLPRPAPTPTTSSSAKSTLPASRLTVHVNVYGHTERQHRELRL
jgi:hypothetical protein